MLNNFGVQKFMETIMDLKKLLIAALTAAVPFMLSAAHYYHYDKKVELEEVENEYSFVTKSSLRSILPSAIISKAHLQKENVYFFKNLSNEEITKLSAFGKIESAYRFKNSTENFNVNKTIFVKPAGNLKGDALNKWLKENNLKFIKNYKYIDWYLVETSGNTLEVAAKLKESGAALYTEPNFYRPVELKAYKSNDTYFNKSWHLFNDGTQGVQGKDHAFVADAWEYMIKKWGMVSPGANVKLAIIDDGFDLEHEDFVGRWSGEKDLNTNFFSVADRPIYQSVNVATGGNRHGTACAGVAAANFDNGIGVAGACPGCTVIPVRIDLSVKILDDVAIESFQYVTQQGADIVSNSWGPSDKNTTLVDMSAPLKELVHKMVTEGRNGKGMIIIFASGNGGEPINTDGFASNPEVIAIGATNSYGKKAAYSDFGPELDFVTPSCDNATGSLTDGIWTTDNFAPVNGVDGAGYVNKKPDSEKGDAEGKYYATFCGTSSAAPLASGIIGLILSINPTLTKDQLYTLLKETSDKVGGVSYNGSGFNDNYGYGRLNALNAVTKASTMPGAITPQDPPDPIDDDPTPDSTPLGDSDLPPSTTDSDITGFDSDGTVIPTSDDPTQNDTNPSQNTDSDVVLIADETTGCGCSIVF